jgi:hypothetical protein
MLNQACGTCARTIPPLKGGLPLLAGTHTDLQAHTQTCRRTHKSQHKSACFSRFVFPTI